MRGKKYLPVLCMITASLLASGFADHGASPASIKVVTVQPDRGHTDVIFEASSPLTFLNSRYDPEKPSTLIIGIDNIRVENEPLVQAEPGTLVRNIELINLDSNRINAVIELAEKMPFSVTSRENHLILELIHYQNPDTSYSLSEAEKSVLERLPTANLNDVRIESFEDALSVTAELTGETVPYVFALKNPTRLVVDLHKTLSRLPPASYPIRQRGIETLRTAQFKVSNPSTITRMVFDLKEPGPFSLDQSGNLLHITFPSAEAAEPSPPPEISLPPQAEQKQASGTETEILPSQNPDPSNPDAAESEKTETTADHNGTILPESGISNPVEKPEKENGIEKTEERTVQSELAQTNQFIPQTIVDTERKFTGELISPKFKDADLRDVILVIAEIAGLNVIFDPGVRGSVTCDFTDVPWDQFLDLILKTNDMGKTIEGNVLRIAPISVLTQEEERLRKLEESRELSGPLRVRTFTLSYSKAREIQSLLQTKISSRGEIIIDDRTNTLVITDVRDKMDLIEKLIELFDTATPQVSIEARIVEATSTFVRNLGIQWGWRGIADPFYGNQTSLKFPTKAIVDGALIPEGIVTKGIGGPLGGYAINLPAPAFTSAIGLSFANILDTFRLDMALSALETSGSGRIISAPKITTQNNQDADIIQGRQIPVQTVANFTVTTRYINAALELSARPQITAEGTIIMEIEIRNNAADFANLVNGIPPIITQSANTTVMVPDGGTTVIGGIYRTEDSITREKVPFLHKVPILGNLFRSFARTKQNRELLIFITPRIIK